MIWWLNENDFLKLIILIEGVMKWFGRLKFIYLRKVEIFYRLLVGIIGDNLLNDLKLVIVNNLPSKESFEYFLFVH